MGSKANVRCARPSAGPRSTLTPRDEQIAAGSRHRYVKQAALFSEFGFGPRNDALLDTGYDCRLYGESFRSTHRHDPYSMTPSRCEICSERCNLAEKSRQVVGFSYSINGLDDLREFVVEAPK